MRIEIQRSGPKFRVVTAERQEQTIMHDGIDTYAEARREAMSIQRNTGWMVVSKVEDAVPASSFHQSGINLPVSSRV